MSKPNHPRALADTEAQAIVSEALSAAVPSARQR